MHSPLNSPEPVEPGLEMNGNNAVSYGWRMKNQVNGLIAGTVWLVSHCWDEWTLTTSSTVVAVSKDANRKKQCNELSTATPRQWVKEFVFLITLEKGQVPEFTIPKDYT